MRLQDLLLDIDFQIAHGSLDLNINKIQFDSRNIKTGDIFIAIKGVKYDGSKFINNVIDSGACVIVSQILPKRLRDGITYIIVEDARKSLAIIAGNFYNHPSRKLKLIGVTGTNGKTTIVNLLEQLFTRLNCKVGMISTIENKIQDISYNSNYTTPDSLEIQRLLSDMVDANCEYCFMEVSSHAIEQHRIYGLTFSAGIFSNITHDHLDYHKTFQEYFRVKKGFFEGLSKEAFVLTNKDDTQGINIISKTNAKTYTYSLKSVSDFKCKIIENDFEGMLLRISNKDIFVHPIGMFNAYNILAVYAAASLFGFNEENILANLSLLKSPNGRFEHICLEGAPTGVIDYAHTDDALKNILETINTIKSSNQDIITVIGCGGDRDKTKRGKIGLVACTLSAQVIFTSDNPRSESSEDIIEDMLSNLNSKQKNNILIVVDRKQAIRTACKISKQKDIILIGGKGHEKYQEINGQKIPFDDRRELIESLQLNIQ